MKLKEINVQRIKYFKDTPKWFEELMDIKPREKKGKQNENI
jgi:hypothetical protein